MQSHIEGITRKLRLPFFCLSIEDSNYVYLRGGSEVIQWRLMLGEDLAWDTGSGAWAAEDFLAHRPPSDEWTSSLGVRISTWSQHCPRSVSPQQVINWLEQDWELVDDFVFKFFEQTGLPVPLTNYQVNP